MRSMLDVLVFVEQRGGDLKKAGLEALGEGKRLADAQGGRAVAVLAGQNVAALAPELGAWGADRVLVADDARLSRYATGAYVRAVQSAVDKVKPAALLMGATAMGKDLAAAIAARLEAGLAADCVELSFSDGALVARRPVFSGKAYATVKVLSNPALATLRPNAFPARKGSGGAPPVEKLDVSFRPEDLRAATREISLAAGGKKELTEAEIVVSGGRGLKGPENFKLIEDLAAALGGAHGASRAVVDAGWRPHAEQVGQTGKTVSPNLYIACGISGAIQHLAGMSSSKVIVAVNTDKEAPIFKVATYGIVGDALQVIPALIEELKKPR